MEGFHIFTIEQTSSETVSVVWKLRSAYHEHVDARYEVLQIGKVGDNLGPNCIRRCGNYQEIGFTDRVNEVVLPIHFEPGVTYTVKLKVFDVDHWMTTGHEISNTVQDTFTKCKFLHIFHFYIYLLVTGSFYLIRGQF